MKKVVIVVLLLVLAVVAFNYLFGGLLPRITFMSEMTESDEITIFDEDNF